MLKKLSCFLLTILALLWQCKSIKVIDLTYKLDPESITWIFNSQYSLTIKHRGMYGDTGLWLENNDFSMAEHTGSHIDAPAHLGVEGQWRVDDIPMDKLIGPGVVINIEQKAQNNPNYAVSVDDVKAWETKYGQIKKGSILLMNSGWTYKYQRGNKTEIFGAGNITDDSTFNFPSWGVPAVEWVLQNRDVNAFGVDTPSTDVGQNNQQYPVHKLLSRNQKVGIESVGYLETLPESGSMVYIGVIKLKDGSGGPARVFATVDEDGGDTNSGDNLMCSLSMLLIAVIYQVLLI